MAKNAHPFSLQFLGAAETVTGSKYLLKAAGKQILIDCGLFQGLKKLRLQNRAIPPFDPHKLDAVLLTHAHLDHLGYLPVLVRHGYRGPVFGTPPTAELARIMLHDSARLQEEEARLANEEGFSQHEPAQPLYDTRDVERTLPLLEPRPLNEWIDLAEGIRFRMQPNGHVLGAAFLEIEVNGQRVVFSGDVGRLNDPLLYDPERPKRSDVLVMESTYGHKNHPPEDPEARLAEIISRTWHNRGTVVIPSFALQRAQMLMYHLWRLRQNGQIPHMPLYFDSPMGAAVWRVFDTYYDWHKMLPRESDQVKRAVTILEDFRDSQKVVFNKEPKVVIASSGMITGGRVLSYLQQHLAQPQSCVVLAGYQAEGTRGRQLQEGATSLKIRGQYYPVRARVEHLQSLSSHAGQDELVHWLGLLPRAPRHLFLTHGEPQASDALRVRLQTELGYAAAIPALQDEFSLS